MTSPIICIFGGTGFLGQYVTQDLARAGYRIKIATRIPESAYDLKLYGDIGQIVPVFCDYKDEKTIQDAVKGCDGVINLIGILYQKGKNTFERAHVDIPSKIAQACADLGVKKLIHVSALGIDRAQSKYAQSKLKGEQEIQKIYPNVTIIRPSVVFGAEDNFFNMFAKLSTILPALPLIGGGQTRFQPVYVGDIAQAILNIVQDKSGRFKGKIYELGGPETVTFEEIYKILLDQTNRKRALVSVPWPIAKIQGFVFGLLPKPILTMDQVRSLKSDNIVQSGALTLIDLGVEPTAMQTILPTYLSCYRRGGHFADKKAA